jgi:hypothetical protein
MVKRNLKIYIEDRGLGKSNLIKMGNRNDFDFYDIGKAATTIKRWNEETIFFFIKNNILFVMTLGNRNAFEFLLKLYRQHFLLSEGKNGTLPVWEFGLKGAMLPLFSHSNFIPW